MFFKMLKNQFLSQHLNLKAHFQDQFAPRNF